VARRETRPVDDAVVGVQRDRQVEVAQKIVGADRRTATLFFNLGGI